MRFLVIGGGPAGAMTARLLRRQSRTHDVLLVERTARVAFQASAPFVFFQYGSARPGAPFLQSIELIQRNGIRLATKTTAVAIDTARGVVVLEGPDGTSEVPFDHVIVATGPGASEVLPGHRSSRSYDELVEVRQLLDTGTVRRVLVSGSHEQSLKLAEQLAVIYPTIVVTVHEPQGADLDVAMEPEALAAIRAALPHIDFRFGPGAVCVRDFDVCIDTTIREPVDPFPGAAASSCVHYVGSVTGPRLSQSFIFQQCVHTVASIVGTLPPGTAPPHFLNNKQFIVGGTYFAHVGHTCRDAPGRPVLTRLSDAYRAEFMPTHDIVHFYMVSDADTGKIYGFQLHSPHDATQIVQTGAAIIETGMTAHQLLLQDFFFQPYFSKPLHLLNLVALAAVGKGVIREEFKRVVVVNPMTMMQYEMQKSIR